MARARFNFPPGFLWGTATSSHQVEGNNTNNNWHTWECEGNIVDNQKSGNACDWWHGRWREDFDRAAETGQNTHRLSIEWSRVQPAPNRFDERAIDQYREMLRGLRERGITPMVTLHHFSDPIWLSEMRGWESDFAADYYQDYVYRIVEGLHEYVDLWCTFNEPNVFVVSGYLLGNFPPGEKRLRSLFRVSQNLIKAHVYAYQEIHEVQPDAKVGMAHHYRGFYPKVPWSPLDKWAVRLSGRLFNNTFPQTLHSGVLDFLGIKKAFPEAKGTQDFFGINYYTSEQISFSPFSKRTLFSKRSYRTDAELSPSGFIANEPATFFQALKWAEHFGLPIYVTENGVEDSDDNLRPKYLIQHIHQMWRAINFNWPIRGYFHWSLVDNFEWERGWSQRFGLWELDRETQTRTRRRSADLYEEICKENAVTSDQVENYIPGLLESMFPG